MKDQTIICSQSKIAGCDFALYPMTDQFVHVIMKALEEVDTSKVWVKTTDVGTCVRGKIVHVFDVTKALFLHAAQTGHHVVFSGTYSIGCPGDSAGDVFLAEDDIRLNEAQSSKIQQNIAGKFSLYPLGGGDYMDMIYSQIEAMKQEGIHVSSIHYATRLDGEGKDVFNGLEQVFTNMEKSDSSHTVMTVTISANSPSKKDVDNNE
ncbi:Ykof family thiamine-binding protein [Virgibacillus pantothenticus]|uniref:Thiamine-binding protein n=1 Tax=Virgibacillus pantothenticus TaxID=1473 RepID=A0A0L0QV08_VIRPA|nr:YkoF family thiamine/hydroxymethylpyrimidine-binding protein [Virgibacillus pantothenticus]KNE22419.1 thiamine-binding protein [Virgibacillus pantothenticus]MBU8565356.1 Ykof family thiamine-binding protein [Virgibacillus pantothenticus]MBU8599425.1 Ykof family thiamine-binding protein [Virgibacillus pantothenticus]MBU8633675.1 Ykof family thiamine-binding protein [Virgibacillus pantothenticus]MBU8641704.1 Ykof family thiamine-binding protein [Virgibacillus pantothenticus]